MGGWALCPRQDTPEVDAPTKAPPCPTTSQVNFMEKNRELLKAWSVKVDPFKAMLHTCTAKDAYV